MERGSDSPRRCQVGGVCGLDEEELLKDEPDYDDIADFCVPLFHDRDTWSAIKAHITDPGARQETSGEMRRSDGSILTYVTKPLPDGNTLIGFADVSAQRSVETALRDRAEAFETADRLKTEFVKNVSYQLRSPLQTILGYGEFLQMERIGDLNEAQRDKVDAICEASNHLNDLIGNILDLAMIEAGRMDLDISEVDLKALIDEAVSIGVTNAADTEVEVIADISPDLGRIEADETRIRQILFNLMSNALRFTDPGGTVTISAERMGDTAKLTVKDNGRGIPAEDQATRFDSFTSSDRRGAGLGLSLVVPVVARPPSDAQCRVRVRCRVCGTSTMDTGWTFKLRWLSRSARTPLDPVTRFDGRGRTDLCMSLRLRRHWTR